MKNLLSFFTFVILLSFTTDLSAQKVTLAANDGSKSGAVEGTDTGDDITIQGATFDVMTTTKGSRFVVSTSKSGNPYNVYIGTKTSNTTDLGCAKDLTVITSKKGTRGALYLNGAGFPRVWYEGSFLPKDIKCSN